MGARQKDLRPALLAAHVVDIGAGAIAWPEHLARDHLVAPDGCFAATEIDDDIAVFDALHDSIDDVADAVLVFLILPVALRLTHFLDDHLLCRLRGDAAEIEGRQGLGDPVADLRRGIFLARIDEQDLCRVVFDLIDDEQQARKPDLAGLRIDLGAHLGFLAIAGARRLLDGVLHRGQDDLPVDRFLARDRVGNLQKFEPVGADGHLASPISASGAEAAGATRLRPSGAGPIWPV